MKAVQQAFPQATVEVWATDQHRVGLKPILRRVWVRKGSRPRVAVQHRFQWLYLYSFVQPASGQTEWLLLPTVRADVFTIALAQFAQAVGAGPAKRILLVLDQAGWHTSKELVVPEGIHLLFLPSHSPELQRMSSACGRSPTKVSPIGHSGRSMIWRPHRSSAVSCCRTSRRSSARTPTFIGGLLPPQNISDPPDLISDSIDAC